ncbi:MAG TPA: hypothetical protein PKD12_08155 [Nitrospira sp.]|nr:hypothetical protein [Nitrospira sp.]
MLAAISDSTIAVLALIVGPLGAYIGVSRRLSGKIGTSEAADLWAESKSLREDASAKLARCDERVVGLEVRVRDLEKDNTTLSRENLDLMRKVNADETDIQTLRARVELLERENEELHALVNTLRQSQDRGSATSND